MEFTGERYIPGNNSRDELSVEHLHRYHSILPLIKDKAVLDIACGEGYGAALMAKTAKTVVGVDISKESIAHAVQTYFAQYPNIRFLEGRAEDIPAADGQFDVVVSFETIEHLSQEGQQQFLAGVKRVLKKNGLFIVSTPDKENYSDRYDHDNPFHIHELTRSEFVNLLAGFFHNAQLMEQGFDIVSAITPADYSTQEQLRLVNWQLAPQPKKRKYLLAIAADEPVPASEVASVVLDTDKDYLQQMDRIIELQRELEDRTAWALRLDAERLQHEAVINTLKEQLQLQQQQHTQALTEKIDLLQNWLQQQAQKKDIHVETLRTQLARQASELENQERQYEDLKKLHTAELVTWQERYEDLKKLQAVQLEEHQTDLQQLQLLNTVLEKQLQEHHALQEKNVQLAAQAETVQRELREKDRLMQDLQFNFSLTRQQLSDVNNRLLTIHDSDGWKALERYYNIKGRWLNENSAHYKFLRKTYNKLRGRKIEEPVPVSVQTQTAAPALEQKREIPIRELPVFQNPIVSIIVPVYNAWEMTEKCLASIIENTTDVAYEVLLADDNSTDDTKDAHEYFKNIVHLRNESNLGFLLNCNEAVKKARGRYLHFLNNDTEVRAGWLSALVRVLDNNEQAGIVGSKLVYPDGRLQEAGGIIWNDASGWNFGQGQNADMPEFNYLKEADYVSGASLLVRASLWQEVGGFDTRYSPAYCEDSDLAFTARQKGFSVWYQPLSEVVHYEGYSHGSEQAQSSISNIKEYQVINNKKFFDKWKTVLQRDQFPNAENVFWAKDRSRFKKTLLMVDHYVPQFDKDAGSRTTFQYLQLFVKLGFNIKFIGENFYRHEPYTTVLQQMGIEVLYGPWYRDNWKQWFTENSKKFDYIYLNRPHISINFIDFFKQSCKAKILYYGHDLHFLREQKRYDLEKNNAILEQAEKWKEVETYLFSNSDVILTPSVAEQQVIQALSPQFNVQLMRPYIYQTVNPPATDFSHRNGLLFVGGFGHLPNVDGVLWFAREVWPFVKVALPGVQFIIAGSHPPEEVKALAGNDVVVKGYVSDAELDVLYATCKMAVIPLRYGAGVKGKTVEAMRYGLPLVTTLFGVEGLPGDYSFIRVTDAAADFATAIIELYNDEAALREQSRQAVAYIQEQFTETTAKEIISNALAV